MPKPMIAQRSSLRILPPPDPPDPVRLYGPAEQPHPFAVTELVVRRAGRVVKRLVACPGGFREVPQ